MDKYEYKVRADEIKALISEGEFAEAVSIADTIDWRRVKSVMMLCTISDLYKINRRYQESRDILLMAYEKHPTGRLIVYSLCELSIKMEEYVQAREYYKAFVQIAPKDTGRYVLQYRLCEALDVSLEERIAVLEEFKKRDYREKWAYELAYLYHRIGLATKCVEECDEMFLWFGEGKYVIKALELKALHEPLNEDQQARYDAWINDRDAEEKPSETEPDEEEEEAADHVSGDTRTAEQIRHSDIYEADAQAEAPAVPTMELPEVKTVDVGQYNTINLQMALAESMKEILEEESADEPAEAGAPEQSDDTVGGAGEAAEPDSEDMEEELDADEAEELVGIRQKMSAAYNGEDDYEPDAESGEEADGDGTEDTDTEKSREGKRASITEAILAPMFQETAKLPGLNEKEMPVQPDVHTDKLKSMDTDELREVGEQIAKEETASFDAQQIVEKLKRDAQQELAAKGDVLTPLNVKPSKYDHFLSQEYDGQISLVVPDAARVEKQITGQLSIEDIMAEWEEMKKTDEQRRMEEVRQRILAHTGNLFADFDEATKNGLLEELERAFVAAIMKDSDKKPAIKKVILPEDDETINSALDAVKAEAEQLAADVASGKSVRTHSEEENDDGVEELEEIEETDAAGADAPDTEAETPEETSESDRVSGEGQDAAEAADDSTPEGAKERDLTPEESELFGQFVHHRKSRRQLVQALDNMSLASYTGNVVITGEEELTTLTLAKALIKEMQYNDSNFSGKVAKISANVLNKKDVAETFARLDNGALIIEKASRLKPETVAKMIKALEKDNMGLFLIMIDKKAAVNQLFADHSALKSSFNLRVDIEPLNDEALVAYARQYAEEMEYSIDEFGILALHTRIADKQTSDHEVSLAEVRELVDEAIHYANKKTPKHFMDILLAKRYDEEDMIILREKDFMHY